MPLGNGFAARVFGPKATQRNYPAIPDAGKAQLVVVIKKELLKPQFNPLIVLLQMRGFADLAFILHKIRDTAGVAQWIQNPKYENGKIVTGELQAVTMLLTGIDKAADDEAISICEMGTDAQGNKIPSAPDTFGTIRAEIRPIVCTLFVTPKGAGDPSIKAAFEALAQAFFDQFGTEGDEAAFLATKK